MDFRDLLITPLFVPLIYGIAAVLRRRMTDEVTQRYYFPALTVKIIGALALGAIYQFYYHGGDTYNFHTHGSRHIWDAFMENPSAGLEMMFSDGQHKGSFFKYSSRIYFFQDKSSYFIIRTAAIFDLLTFSTYSSTALFFALISFVGMWLLFLVFYRRYPHLHKQIAVVCFFIPSVFFWGSGLLKDTIMMGCLGGATYSLDALVIQRRFSIGKVILLLLCLFVVFSVKKFILQAFLPCALLWVYLSYVNKIQSRAARVIILPFVLALIGVSGYYSVLKVGEGDVRYSVDKIAFTARETALDIALYTGRDAGSTYTLGELDGTMSGMLRLAPVAINVSLFRPYVWEVRNPLMLLSALESLAMLILTVVIVVRKKAKLLSTLSKPDIIFCLSFSIIYAFAVGVSTFNFGTLARYKIPLLPFFGLVLVLSFYENRDNTTEELDATE